jgi:hypothetical protein
VLKIKAVYRLISFHSRCKLMTNPRTARHSTRLEFLPLLNVVGDCVTDRQLLTYLLDFFRI